MVSKYDSFAAIPKEGIVELNENESENENENEENAKIDGWMMDGGREGKRLSPSLSMILGTM